MKAWLSRGLALAAWVLLSIGVAGCIPEDVPVTPFDRGGAQVRQIAMGSTYATQVFYDFESDSVVATQPLTTWDIGVITAGERPAIVLNSAKIMGASDLGPLDFATPVSAPKMLVYRYDDPSGDLDSTAVGEWWENVDGAGAYSTRGHLYIIDRGFDAAGRTQGYERLMILGATAENCTIRCAGLDGSNDRTIVLSRDSIRTVAAVIFDNDPRAVDAEPERDRWDILFTRYTHIFRDPDIIPYSVTGVLLNRWMTVVAVDSTRQFSEITTANLPGYQLEARHDGVGYAWKTYDLNAGAYTVNPGITYILRTSTGFYYKLHFTEFYNDAGEKGYPRFEYQKL